MADWEGICVADAHGMVAYADWGAEFCPYHNPDGSPKTVPGRLV